MSELFPNLLTREIKPPSGNNTSELYLPNNAIVFGDGYKSLFSGFLIWLFCEIFLSIKFLSPKAVLTIEDSNGSFLILFGLKKSKKGKIESNLIHQYVGEFKNQNSNHT